ncbi:nucleoside hydrolase [Microbacterium sp. G2-8]|uniref:nucleoside hydrolase n=1 Tax=Microbacterium sp. G2-8 TaxID=2842454 RepID=UPI001C8AA004|nr:nucleoside hydrolase [Microbacterium sp. G2-8]
MLAAPRRVIINTDAKNEADDQFAIVHALLSPTLDIRGIVPAHFGTGKRSDSLRASREEVDLLLRLMGREGEYVVADGATHALPDPVAPVPSAGSALIIEESKKDEGTLYIPFLGPLTDMASAILEDPEIQDRDVVVVWIGGPPHDDLIPGHAPEFNLSNDIVAANIVMDSRIPVWQIPMSVYAMVSVGHEELRQKVSPLGELGAYLTQQVIEFNARGTRLMMDFRSLGDSPAIGVIMNPRGATWRSCPAPFFDADGSMREPEPGRREIPVCESIDTRWLMEDMFAKLRAFDAAQRPARTEDPGV